MAEDGVGLNSRNSPGGPDGERINCRLACPVGFSGKARGAECVGSILNLVKPSGCSWIICAHSRHKVGLIMSLGKSPWM